MQPDAIDQGQRAKESSNGLSSDHASDRREARAVQDASDRELVLRVRSGDADALAALYDRYAATVTGLARGILRDTRLAEEAAHDVFLGLWQNPHGYDASRGPFAAWLFRVARNRAIDLFRRRREQPFGVTPINDQGESLDPTTFLVDGDPDPADQAVTALQREAVRAGLRELTADHRRLLELAYFRSMTQSEIATCLGRPLGTVKTQIRSAMKKLSDVLADSAPEYSGQADPIVPPPTDQTMSRVTQSRGVHTLDATARPRYGDVPGDANRK